MNSPTLTESEPSLADVRLDEYGRALRVDAGRQELRGRPEDTLPEQHRVLLDGQGVKIGDPVERVVAVLQRHPLPQRAQVVAEVHRVGGGLDEREDPGTGPDRDWRGHE